MTGVGVFAKDAIGKRVPSIEVTIQKERNQREKSEEKRVGFIEKY